MNDSEQILDDIPEILRGDNFNPNLEQAIDTLNAVLNL